MQLVIDCSDEEEWQQRMDGYRSRSLAFGLTAAGTGAAALGLTIGGVIEKRR